LTKQLLFFFLSSKGIWSSGIGKKIATYDMYIAKLRDGSKRVKNLFSNQFREKAKMEGEREWNHTKELKLKCFSPLKISIPLL
jgi:hypothetical protein